MVCSYWSSLHQSLYGHTDTHREQTTGASKWKTKVCISQCGQSTYVWNFFLLSWTKEDGWGWKGVVWPLSTLISLLQPHYDQKYSLSQICVKLLEPNSTIVGYIKSIFVKNALKYHQYNFNDV